MHLTNFIKKSTLNTKFETRRIIQLLHNDIGVKKEFYVGGRVTVVGKVAKQNRTLISKRSRLASVIYKIKKGYELRKWRNEFNGRKL